MKPYLDVAEYCDGCSRFEPHVDKIVAEQFDYDKQQTIETYETCITCQNKQTCERIAKHIKSTLERNIDYDFI